MNYPLPLPLLFFGGMLIAATTPGTAAYNETRTPLPHPRAPALCLSILPFSFGGDNLLDISLRDIDDEIKVFVVETGWSSTLQANDTAAIHMELEAHAAPNLAFDPPDNLIFTGTDSHRYGWDTQVTPDPPPDKEWVIVISACSRVQEATFYSVTTFVNPIVTEPYWLESLPGLRLYPGLFLFVLFVILSAHNSPLRACCQASKNDGSITEKWELVKNSVYLSHLLLLAATTLSLVVVIMFGGLAIGHDGVIGLEHCQSDPDRFWGGAVAGNIWYDYGLSAYGKADRQVALAFTVAVLGITYVLTASTKSGTMHNHWAAHCLYIVAASVHVCGFWFVESAATLEAFQEYFRIDCNPVDGTLVELQFENGDLLFLPRTLAIGFVRSISVMAWGSVAYTAAPLLWTTMTQSMCRRGELQPSSPSGNIGDDGGGGGGDDENHENRGKAAPVAETAPQTPEATTTASLISSSSDQILGVEGGRLLLSSDFTSRKSSSSPRRRRAGSSGSKSRKSKRSKKRPKSKVKSQPVVEDGPAPVLTPDGNTTD